MGKRVLIMVLAFDEEPWRTIEAEGQRRTWAASDARFPILWLRGRARGPVRLAVRASVFGLRRLRLGAAAQRLTVAVARRYAARRVRRVGARVETRVPESYVMSNAKTVAGFRHALESESFDYLLRTNSSTYVDLQALQQHVDGLGRDSYYGGTAWSLEGLEYATGTSILLSRDLVTYAAYDPEWEFGVLDDVALGRSMRRAGVRLDPFVRCDVSTDDDLGRLTSADLAGCIVVRCRGAEGRDHDVRAMRRIHELLVPPADLEELVR